MALCQRGWCAGTDSHLEKSGWKDYFLRVDKDRLIYINEEIEMKKILIGIYGVAVLCLSGCGQKAAVWEVASPDGNVRFVTETVGGEGEDTELQYKIMYKDSVVVNPSRLGIVMNGHEYGRNVRLEDVAFKSIDESYELKAGKRLLAHNRCEEMTLTFADGHTLPFQFIVRVFDDGAAFRYSFPAQVDSLFTIENELTEFAVPVGGKAWIHPYDWNDRFKPSYEQYSKNEIAVNALPDHDKGWAFPMLFHTNGVWMMITEACLDGTYPATHVDNSGKGEVYKIRFPEAEEPVIPDSPEPVSTLPWCTPWRAIVIGTELNTVFTTQMVSHLNPPSVIEDASWIKAGRSAWSWWYDGSSARSYKEQLKYVDLCCEMGWEYLLIDAGWPDMDGKGVEGVVAYAAERGIGVWLWYHSGSGRGEDTPLQHRLMADTQLRRAEMERISKMGVKGIKVDFFDTDKQRIIANYPAILKDAADYRLLVDLHGATLPRGLERTYPNLLTTEAIRGAETLGRQERCDRAAEHNATVPFTRNVVGSMDYTPVTFSNKIRQGVPAFRRTSVAHQLALAVVFESGFQCFADRAEAYLSLPEIPRDFLKKVPAAWDESLLLAGYPSDYVVVAWRKGDTWFIGGINGKNQEREISFALPESGAGKAFTLIKDGEDIHSFDYEEVKPEDGRLHLTLAGNGGFAAIIN